MSWPGALVPWLLLVSSDATPRLSLPKTLAWEGSWPVFDFVLEPPVVCWHVDGAETWLVDVRKRRLLVLLASIYIAWFCGMQVSVRQYGSEHAALTVASVTHAEAPCVTLHDLFLGAYIVSLSLRSGDALDEVHAMEAIVGLGVGNATTDFLTLVLRSCMIAGPMVKLIMVNNDEIMSPTGTVSYSAPLPQGLHQVCLLVACTNAA
jgi:hypothetical protein